MIRKFMNPRIGSWVALAALLWPFPETKAEPESPRTKQERIQSVLQPNMDSAEIRRRLRPLQAADLLRQFEENRDLIKDLEFLKDLEKYQGEFPFDTKNPAVRELVKSLEIERGNQDKQTDYTSEHLKTLKRLVDSLPKQLPPGSNQANSSPSGKSRDAGNSAGPIKGETPFGLKFQKLNPPELQNPGPNTGMAQLFTEKSGLLRNMDGPLKDSPAVKQALRDWERYYAESRNGDYPNGASVAPVLNWLNSNQSWFDKTWPKGARLPRLRPFISSSGSGLNLPFPSLPTLGMSGPGSAAAIAPSSSETGIALMWAIVVVVAGVCFWKLFRRRSADLTIRQGPEWKLGPWPIDPTTVATRMDLVLAFEYLSQLKLGPNARSWNHLEIVGALSQLPAHASDEHRAGAGALGALYERARYSPANEPLEEEAFHAARRHLCLLAHAGAV